MLTADEALKRYNFDIARLSHRCPLSYKQDLIQELTLCVLQCHKLTNSCPNDDYIKINLLKRSKQFMKLERNHGIRYCPDDVDSLELESQIAQHYANIKADNQNRLSFSNTP
jgi:hypothetical protein